MDNHTNAQVITTLAELTRLEEDNGLLLALYPDFILAVRPGMNAAEDLSLPVMEDPEYETNNSEDGLTIPPDMLDEAGFLGLDYDEDLIYTVEAGRIIIEMEDE